MEIRDEHVDFAVVYRLREMLVCPPAVPYNVSLSYGLFCAILCWSMQHIRMCETSNKIQSPVDEAAINVAKTLTQTSASAPPWRCKLEKVDEPHGKERLKLSTNEIKFELSAFGLLKMIRDGMAHGDRKNVKPIHSQASRGNRTLRGFEVRLEWKPKCEFGRVQLLREDMVRIGGRLADDYCAALQAVAGDSYLAEDAKIGLVEAA